MAPMKTCRACLSGRMLMFLPLGVHPPANAFLRADQLHVAQPAWALDTHVCLSCGLIQVPNVIPTDYFRHYLYVPSTAETMHAHFEGLADAVGGRMEPSARNLVVDIGCNDGLFLAKMHERGVRTLGIDPAANLSGVARTRGIDVYSDYFNTDTARVVRTKYGRARVMTTTNTLNHIDDLHGFMQGVTELLDDGGTLVIEVPRASDLVDQNEFDTVYHEHVSEFSVKSLVDLLGPFGLVVEDVHLLGIHGGSMRVFAGRGRPAETALAPQVEALIALERAAGLLDAATYNAFAGRVYDIREQLMTLLRRLKAEGHRLAGYGAPAKGNTLLNFCSIGPDLLSYLVDRSPLKHGLYSPGMRIPIVPVERLLEDGPGYVLILAWNFADEIIRQQDAFRRRGGRFILPIPEPRVIE